jgi:hypothetical protein
VRSLVERILLSTYVFRTLWLILLGEYSSTKLHGVTWGTYIPNCHAPCRKWNTEFNLKIFVFCVVVKVLEALSFHRAVFQARPKWSETLHFKWVGKITNRKIIMACECLWLLYVWPSSTLIKSTFCSHRAFMYFVWISKKQQLFLCTALVHKDIINWNIQGQRSRERNDGQNGRQQPSNKFWKKAKQETELKIWSGVGSEGGTLRWARSKWMVKNKEQ